MKQHELKVGGKTLVSRQTDYDHTISGVLHRRVTLYHEAERLRDRLAEIKNDIHAIDRTLNVLGYEGQLDEAMPRQKRDVIFGRGELTRAIQRIIRTADGPTTSRHIAQEIMTVNAMDAQDRKFMSDLAKLVGKALRVMHEKERVRKGTDANGNVVWSQAA